jgi:hypothetical protein
MVWPDRARPRLAQVVDGAGTAIAMICGGSGVTGEMSMPHKIAIEPKELEAVTSTEWRTSVRRRG